MLNSDISEITDFPNKNNCQVRCKGWCGASAGLEFPLNFKNSEFILIIHTI